MVSSKVAVLLVLLHHGKAVTVDTEKLLFAVDERFLSVRNELRIRSKA